MAADRDVLERASDYITRAVRNRKNFDMLLAEGALDKASETLWGLFTDYTNALALVTFGRTFARHGETISYAREIGKTRGDGRMLRAVSAAERMHANFYHGFVTDPSSLREPFEEITYYATVLDGLIRASVSPWRDRRSSSGRSREPNDGGCTSTCELRPPPTIHDPQRPT